MKLSTKNLANIGELLQQIKKLSAEVIEEQQQLDDTKAPFVTAVLMSKIAANALNLSYTDRFKSDYDINYMQMIHGIFVENFCLDFASIRKETIKNYVKKSHRESST